MAMGYIPKDEVLVIPANADDDILYDQLLMKIPCNLDLIVKVRISTVNYVTNKPLPLSEGVTPAGAYVRIRVWQSTKSESYRQNRYFVIGTLGSPMHYGSSFIPPYGGTDHVLISGRANLNDEMAALDDYITKNPCDKGQHVVAWTPYGRIPVDHKNGVNGIRAAMNLWRNQANDTLLDFTTFEITKAIDEPLVPQRADAAVFAELPTASIPKILNGLDTATAGGYGLVVIDPNGVRMAAKHLHPPSIVEAIRVMIMQLSEDGRRTTSFWVAPADWPLMKVVENNTAKEAAKAKVSTLKKGGPALDPGGVGKAPFVPLEDKVAAAEKEVLGVDGIDVSPETKKIEPLGPDGVPITSLPKLTPDKQPAWFKDKLFCLTGTLSADRDKVAKLIAFMGGKSKNSVTTGTKVLVIGTKPGTTKVAAAKKFNTQICTELDFWKHVPENIRLQFFKENALAMVMQWSNPVDGSIVPDEKEVAASSESEKAPPAGGRKVLLD